MTGQRRIDIVTAEEPPTCPRCSAEGLLLARVPNEWTNASGAAVEGRNGVVLCAGCDTDAPAAAPLITWFHVHGSAGPEQREEFAQLLVAWAEQVSVPAVNEQRLEAETALWRSGQL
ncbi:DUF6300 family protein [Nonomuraea sp. NBC_00507]|uniref:DUF6300 family protein n=1 Tax=Nonomuraea sp. NBC_00507 TaxID=2976002 RepID=UPI002E19A428